MRRARWYTLMHERTQNNEALMDCICVAWRTFGVSGESGVKGQFHLQCSAFFFSVTSCGSCAVGCGDRQPMHLHQQQSVHLSTLIFLKSQVPVDASGRLLSSPASCQKCVSLARSMSKWVRLVSNTPWRLKEWKHSRFRCQRSCDSLKKDLDELKRNI